MKRLYLVRHAKSSWDFPQLADSERPLNKRGLKDARFMGLRLKKYHKAKPQFFASSPAMRALSSARIIAKQLGYSVKKIKVIDTLYQANILVLLKTVKSIDDSANQAMIVGHNPELSRFASYLSPLKLEEMPTCAVLCFDFKADSWKAIGSKKGIVVFFDYPKKHAKKK